MLQVELVALGNCNGKYKGSLEVATTPTGDLLLTATDEEANESEKVEGSFYLTHSNAKKLAEALLKGAVSNYNSPVEGL